MTFYRHTSPEDRRFRSDLLVDADDLETARSLFPKVYYLLDHPELRAKYAHYAATANRAKARVRGLGCLATAAGALALLSAAADPFWKRAGDPEFVRFALEPVGMLVAGVAGALLLLGPWRQRRVEARFLAERIRQWHFQMLVRMGGDIEASFGEDDEAGRVDDFRRKRQQWFAEFLGEHERTTDTRLAVFAGNCDGGSDDWLLASGSGYAANSRVLPYLYEVYRRLRIGHRIDSVSRRVSETGNATRGRAAGGSGGGRGSVVRKVAAACFFTVFFGSAAIVVGRWVGFRPDWFPYLVSATVMAAIAGVALRMPGEGLGIRSDRERHQDYLGRLRRLRNRFERCSSQDERLRVMEKFEMAAVDELRRFVRTHREAAFRL